VKYEKRTILNCSFSRFVTLRQLTTGTYVTFIYSINVKKNWFIHELTAHYTSKTAKKLRKGDYPPAHRLIKCQCAVE